MSMIVWTRLLRSCCYCPSRPSATLWQLPSAQPITYHHRPLTDRASHDAALRKTLQGQLRRNIGQRTTKLGKQPDLLGTPWAQQGYTRVLSNSLTGPGPLSRKPYSICEIIEISLSGSNSRFCLRNRLSSLLRAIDFQVTDYFKENRSY